MDKNGDGIEVDISDMMTNDETIFEKFTPDMFLTCCILSGCDYLDSIKGIGLKKA